jgi:hypothetical protein
LNGTLKTAIAKGEKPLVKTTAAKGMFKVKSLPAGTYTATVVKPGFKEQVLTVTVSDGDMTELRVELEKN